MPKSFIGPDGVRRDVEDAAKRIREEYALHRLADPLGNIGRWFAFALADGRSDHILYQTKRDAVRGQHHNEDRYGYMMIRPCDVSVRDCQIYLETMRKVYASGRIKLADRDHYHGGLDLIPRVTMEDQYAQLRAMFIGDVAPRNIIIPDYGRFS